MFRNNKRNGKGKLVYPKGKVEEGIHKDDKFIKKIDDKEDDGILKVWQNGSQKDHKNVDKMKSKWIQ